MKQSNILSFLSLATKAGKTASGEFQTENEVKSGGAWLVIVAEDASENTKKKFRNLCAFYEVPLSVLFTKEELGAATGKEMRASLAVTDEGFASGLMKKIRAQESTT